MQVPGDLEVVSRSAGSPGKDKVLDLVLGEKQGGRRLLIRVLAAGSSHAEARLTQTDSKLEAYEKEHRGRVTHYQRITLPLKSVIGHYIVLLYPLRDGDSVPDTTWTARQLTIALPGQSDVLDFTTGGDGRTRFTVRRDGITIAAMQ